MIKPVFIAAGLMLATPVAHAAEPAAAMSMIKGSNVYQSRIISDVRPDQQQPEPVPVINPVSVEPASGFEPVESSEEMMEGRDALRSLQEAVQSAPQNQN